MKVKKQNLLSSYTKKPKMSNTTELVASANGVEIPGAHVGLKTQQEFLRKHQQSLPQLQVLLIFMKLKLLQVS